MYPAISWQPTLTVRRRDLAVTDFYGVEVSILLGNGDGTFQAGLNSIPCAAPASLAVGNFNGDGKAEVLAVSCRDEERLYWGTGTGHLALNRGLCSGYFNVVVADLQWRR